MRDPFNNRFGKSFRKRSIGLRRSLCRRAGVSSGLMSTLAFGAVVIAIGYVGGMFFAPYYGSLRAERILGQVANQFNTHRSVDKARNDVVALLREKLEVETDERDVFVEVSEDQISIDAVYYVDVEFFWGTVTMEFEPHASRKLNEETRFVP